MVEEKLNIHQRDANKDNYAGLLTTKTQEGGGSTEV